MALSNKTVFAAIDIGTNAVRLKLARPLPDGTLEPLHQERDPVRPGEGVFSTGAIPPTTAARLLSTLRRYGAQCRRYQATVRTVATSAVRSAKNKADIIRRVRDEAELELEVVSGKEEARLICLGVLHDQPAGTRSVCIDIGGGSTEVACAEGERPTHLFSARLGAVRLAETFEATGRVTEQQVLVMREYAREVLDEAIPRKLPVGVRHAVGSSGTIQAVIEFASDGGKVATPGQLVDAVDRLVALGTLGRRKQFEARRADIIVAGAIILEAVVRHLRLKSITAVDRGLRDGILIDMLRRGLASSEDPRLADAALIMGRRFDFDEGHAQQVARLSLSLFDDLAGVHKLPLSVRPYLHVAALLHDIGSAVSHERHHKHTLYLIQHADLPGLSDRERELVARIARYHRRSPPELTHGGLSDLPPSDGRVVRKLATLLRIADSLDRSHHQPVRSLKVEARPGGVAVSLRARAPVDLELWDAAHEAALFRRVFGRRLLLQTARR